VLFIPTWGIYVLFSIRTGLLSTSLPRLDSDIMKAVNRETI
jgi:hypothetical protein